jgi:hypothetical protein
MCIHVSEMKESVLYITYIKAMHRYFLNALCDIYWELLQAVL